MLVFKKNGNQAEFALTFADAIARFGFDLEEANLAQAYCRSGRVFTGQLEQTFVILTEKGRDDWRKKRESWEASDKFRDGTGRGRGRGRGRGQKFVT